MVFHAILCDFMGFYGIYPIGNDCYIAIEHGPVQIVNFPSSIVIFNGYVKVYQRVRISMAMQ